MRSRILRKLFEFISCLVLLLPELIISNRNKEISQSYWPGYLPGTAPPSPLIFACLV